METADDVLEHFGIKGMKWGIRKDKSSSASAPDAARAKATQDLIKKHGTQAVDNKDLQHLVTRMNLEKQYNSLMDQNPGKIKKGHNFIKEYLGYVKTGQEIYNLATSPMAKSVGSAIAKETAKAKTHHKGPSMTITNRGQKQTVKFS